MKDLRDYLPGSADFPAVDYWEVRLEAEAQTTVKVKNGEVEAITRQEFPRGNVRVLVRGGWGFSSFNRFEDVRAHVGRAVDFARSVGGGDAGVVPLAPQEAELRARYDQHPDEVPLAKKLEVARSYDELLRAHAAVATAEVLYEDTVRNKVFANSEGSVIRKEEVAARGAVIATGKADGVPETHSESYRYRAGFEAFEALGEAIPAMLAELEEQLAAVDARGGTYNVVINPKIAGVFAHEAFGHTSEADHFYRDPQLSEVMRLGRTMGSEAITIVDDATLDPKLAGFLEYDDEGVPGSRTVLLDRGILTGHLHSRTTAARMGGRLTGNARALNASFPPLVRMTTTLIEPGEATEEDLLRELGEGLLVKDSRGGSGGENFTFNARVGYLVENGKPTRPVKNFTLTGNLFTTLKNVVACSNRQEEYSTAGGCGRGDQFPLPVSFGSPYVLIKDALIGGK